MATKKQPATRTSADYQRERYERLRAEHKCGKCATKLHKNDEHAYCADCRKYLADRERARKKARESAKGAARTKAKPVAKSVAVRRVRARG